MTEASELKARTRACDWHDPRRQLLLICRAWLGENDRARDRNAEIGRPEIERGTGFEPATSTLGNLSGCPLASGQEGILSSTAERVFGTVSAPVRRFPFHVGPRIGPRMAIGSARPRRRAFSPISSNGRANSRVATQGPEAGRRRRNRYRPGGVQHSQGLARRLTVAVQLVHVNVDSVGGGI
jgi:hypothetical protein